MPEAIDTLKKAMPLHQVAALVAPGLNDQIQLSRLTGELMLALRVSLPKRSACARKTIGRRARAEERTREIASQAERGHRAWGVAFAIAIANRVLAGIEQPNPTGVPTETN